jgi:transcription elongation GreA/GreB family factor
MSPDAHKDTTSQEPMGQELSALIHRNWKEMISLMGVVSRQDYDALVRENDALKKKLEVQEERIQQLQSMLQHKGIFDLQQMAESFQDVLKNQSEQFQDLMQSIQASWQNEGESSSGPDDT